MKLRVSTQTYLKKKAEFKEVVVKACLTRIKRTTEANMKKLGSEN